MSTFISIRLLCLLLEKVCGDCFARLHMFMKKVSKYSYLRVECHIASYYRAYDICIMSQCDPNGNCFIRLDIIMITIRGDTRNTFSMGV